MTALVGIALQPDDVFFAHNRDLLERAELFEVTPETATQFAADFERAQQLVKELG